MQRGGGVISWEKLGPYLEKEKDLKSFYVAWGIFSEITWDNAVENVIKKEIPNFNRDSVDVPALIKLYKTKTGIASNKNVIARLEALQTELQKPEQNPDFV
jgi:hypothetical protein